MLTKKFVRAMRESKERSAIQRERLVADLLTGETIKPPEVDVHLFAALLRDFSRMNPRTGLVRPKAYEEMMERCDAWLRDYDRWMEARRSV